MAAAEKEEEEKETACASPTAVGDGKVVVPPLILELSDELWFFRNALGRNDRPASRALPLSPEKADEEVAAAAVEDSPVEEDRPRAARRLLRTPSMPAYRTRPSEEYSGPAVCFPRKSAGGDGANGGRGVSRRSLAPAGSMPANCDGEEGVVAAQREGGRDGPRTARRSKLQRSSSGCPTENPRASSRLRPNHFASQTHFFVQANYRTYSVRGKKWLSHSDLESFEVQGFKDLGFVFDAGASHLASFIPGLREKRPSDDDSDAIGRPRPYLSEAWFVERSAAAAPKLEWLPAERRSAAEMRERLRFWARAVACNARQES